MTEPVICRRCILDSNIPGVHIEDDGICNHCSLHDKLEVEFELNDENRAKFEKLVEKIKRKGRKGKYDCVVGLSGGTDSTFCLYTAVKLGLRPLAVNFDNGWRSQDAIDNIEKATKALGVDLRILSPDWSDMRDYYIAALKASIPETCIACEIGIASSLYGVAEEEGIHYIILGTSYRTEGITPLRWHYLDGAYFEDIVRRFSPGKKGRTKLNRTRLPHLVRYMLKGIKTVQLPMYIDYHEFDIRKTLETELGWVYGGRHHFDCMFKPMRAYVGREKFDLDYRKMPLAALVRTGEMKREDALAVLADTEADDSRIEHPACRESIDHTLEKLGISREEFEEIMKLEPKVFNDYRSYYSFLKVLGPFIKEAAKMRLVPETLYEKLFKMV